MELFKYRAVNRDGKIKKDTIEAVDKDDAIRKLKELKYTPLNVSAGSILDSNIEFTFLERITAKDLAIFSKQFSLLLESGIAVLSSLDILKRQTEKKKLKKVIGQMQEEVQKGHSLHAAMRKQKDIFPEIMLNIVESGETTGNLEDSFDKMSIHFDKEIALSGKLKGSLTYAIVLSVIATGVIAILLTAVVPNFVNMFQSAGAELPFTTKTLLALSSFLIKYWYIIIAAIILLIIGFKVYKRTEQGILLFDTIKISLPVIGDLNRKIIIARFSRTLASLIGSGLPLYTALEVISRILGNKVYQKAIEKARQDVGYGFSLTQALTETNLFMRMVLQMVKVGEDTGRLESTLNKISDFYDEEIIQATGKVASLLEPAMMIVLAVIVGFIVLSIVQPMFGMLNTINNVQ